MKVVITKSVRRWLGTMRDRRGKARIVDYIRKLKMGENLGGDTKYVGDGVYEARFNFGPGYRLYMTYGSRAHEKIVVVILLCGGNKATQSRDIKQARQMVKEWANHGIV